MSERPDLRVSDADRERVAAAIREHYAAGRLSGDELDERLRDVYAARTESELSALLADLPALPGEPAPVPAAVAEERAALQARRGKLHRQVLHRAGGGVGVFLVCTIVWLATGSSGSFWPVWALVGTAVGVVRPMWDLWGPAPDLDRVEEELNRRRGGRRRRLSP